jgi:uncharacterized metal-binding protein YceD (DUF177 family)
MGTHEFSISLDSKFFDLFENSEVKTGLLKAEITLLRSSDSMHLKIDMKGTVDVECDRCLDTYPFQVDCSNELSVEIGEENSDLSDADDRITLSRRETSIDLSQHFFDYINLSLPIRKIHPKDENGKSTCNKDMIKKLKNLKVKESPQEIDPRWDNLKTLLN